VRVQIPRRLWGALGGKREFVKALGTRDLDEAVLRKHLHVAEFKRRIAELEANGEDPNRERFEAALTFKDVIQRNAGRTVHVPADPERPEPMDGWWLSQASDEAKKRAMGESW
jgi:hypothetical protein